MSSMMKSAEKNHRPSASNSLVSKQMRRSRFGPGPVEALETENGAAAGGAPLFSYNLMDIPASPEAPAVQCKEPEDEEIQMKPSCPGCEEEEEAMQAKFVGEGIVPTVQRQTDPDSEEDEALQGKFLPIHRIAPHFGYNLMNLLSHPSVQPKLLVGPADDKYEREADRIAENAVSMAEPSSLQRQLGDEEEELQTKSLAEGITSLVQRQVDADEEEKLQTKPLIQCVSIDGMEAGAELEQSINQARGSGMKLENGVRSRMEGAFGVDFGSVRIHSDADADRFNRSIQARAFTTGQDIFLGQGEYRPGSSEGEKLLAHELTHVVQQNGIVLATASQPSPIVRRHSTIIQRGELTETIGCINETWGQFEGRYKEVKDHLATVVIPRLRSFTKAGSGGKKGKDLPQKKEAKEVASGLSHWVTEATEGADRYYAELRSAKDSKADPLEVYMGKDTDKEPDFSIHTAKENTSYESKSLITDKVTSVDGMIRQARGQSAKRQNHPQFGMYTGWHNHIEIKNINNTWPFPPSEVKKMKIHPWAAPGQPEYVNDNKIIDRAKDRNLKPQDKKGNYIALPVQQQNKHQIDIVYLYGGIHRPISFYTND